MALTISYIDPGYGAGLDGVTCVENETYNPINGVAFTSVGHVGIPISSGITTLSSANQTKVVTVRFLIFNSTGVQFEASFYHSSPNFGTYYYKIFCPSDAKFHNVALARHVIINLSNKTQAYIMRTIQDIDSNITTTDVYTMSNNPDSSSLQKLLRRGFGTVLQFLFPVHTTGVCYVSNVIVTVGDEALSSGAFPVKLPLKNTSGDFISLGGGEYVGNSKEQKLLSVVDASDVITKFGASSKVSHLVSYGHPGYRVGANITSATGITEENRSIAAHGSCSLSTDTDASAAVAWAVDNTRLSDVDGMKIGWQV